MGIIRGGLRSDQALKVASTPTFAAVKSGGNNGAVNTGVTAVEYGDADRWVVVTRDGKNAAHFEHTLAMTEGGVDVLTDGR